MISYFNLTTFYVSQKFGKDSNTGFYKDDRADLNGPFKTIDKALEKVAEMRRVGADQPVSVVITDEIYYVDKPIVINENMHSITVKAYDKCKISGGIKIENFKEDIYNGKKCLSAPVEGIEDGFWFTDFYVDNKRADFTCYPKDGLLFAEDVENRGTGLFDSSKWFIAKKEDVKEFSGFKNFGDCFISYNHYWVDEHTPIESYDLKNGKIFFRYPSRYTIEPTHPASKLRYKLENVAECFENKNEWYLDRELKRVYYIPRDDSQTADSIEAFAPVTDKLFVIKGTKENKVKNIRLENLIFADTKGDYKSIYINESETGKYFIDESCDGYASDIQSVCWANGSIEFYNAHNCYLEKCVLENLGIHAVTVNEGCDRITIADNDFYDIGAGAIKINGGEYGCEKEKETYGNVVKNNIITECGKRYFAACGILIMHSYENTVSNNEISYQYYTGISVGWVWGYKDNITKDNLIEKNYIHHIGLGKLSDMGGIYLLGKQSGTIVRNNIIHDVISAHYGGWALYTDEGSSYITLENNICYNTSNNSYHQHYGSMNTVRNNIFAKSKLSPVALSRPEMHLGLICENNIIVAEDTSIYRTGYEEDYYGNVQMLAAHSNLLFNKKGDTYLLNIGDKYYNLDEAQRIFGIDDSSISEDPQFVDYENDNYELKETSPAFKMGFKKIDTSDIGAKR